MKNPEFTQLEMPGADVRLYQALFSEAESKELLEQLQREIAWQQDRIKMFGREMPLPRLTAWYGDPGAVYTYSRIRMEPRPWNPVLQQIRKRAEAATQTVFNSVLLNYYRNQQDSMGWHADNEAALGLEPVIASVSFGEPREFQFRHLTNKALPIVKIYLPPGSLLLMQGTTQQNWQHRLPGKTAVSGPRINLTFRQILTS